MVSKGGSGAEYLASLAQQLTHDDAAMRIRAAQALSAQGARAHGAIPELTIAIADPSPAVRAGAAWALFKIGADETAVPLLIAGLKDADPHVRFCSARGLVTMRPSPIKALAALMEALKEEQRSSIADSVRWALQVIDPASIPPLSDALRSPDARLRRRAAATLSSNTVERARAALPSLLAALAHDDADVRLFAAQSVGDIARRCKDDGAALGAAWAQTLRALSELLSDPEARVRERAAWALMWLGSSA